MSKGLASRLGNIEYLVRVRQYISDWGCVSAVLVEPRTRRRQTLGDVVIVRSSSSERCCALAMGCASKREVGESHQEGLAMYSAAAESHHSC